MKTLKKPVVPPERHREASNETFDIEGNVSAAPVFSPEIHEDKRTAQAKILIVNDQPAGRAVLRKELQAAHYDVIAAENEAEAMNLAATIRPDLILLDVKMPLMEGEWASEGLKNSWAMRSIPIIFLADEDGTDEIPTGRGLGPVDYVVKPYCLKELHARIRKALALQDEQRKFYGEAQKFKGHFIALVSNELRNHVTVIAGFAALLEQKAGRLAPSVQRAYLQEIIQHTDHLADLTDGFEALLHAKGMVEKVDLFQAVASAVEAMRPLIEKKEQSLIIKPPPRAALTVRGCRRDLIIAVRHLLSYVHRYTTPGGTIGVEILSKNQQGRIEVTTPGLAIAHEQKDQISMMGETDLGLAIVQWVAEQQGGSIGIESRPGRGHCFWLSLPCSIGVVS
ncbi:MAG: hybrid sensor histidine kinase/response regulator [Nitrospirae bacterium]|nr:hybrid sensor histidine kinase/response regulator [Nitrospirota bacterium]